MIEEFKIEAAEMFESAEEGFLNIEKGQDFLGNFNLIFRSFHSLKGAAGMFGLSELQNHMHKLESLFEAQKPKNAMGKAQIDYFLSGIDAAKVLLSGGSSLFHHLSEEQLNQFNSSEAAAPVLSVAPTQKKASKAQGPQRGLIYIVDDEGDILEILESYMSELNFEVKTFLSAQSALDAIVETPPDIVLSDIAMPIKDGIALVKEVREINPTVTFIMISGNITKERMLELISYDVYGFIEKPFREDEIKTICERVFSIAQLNTLLTRSLNYILYQFSDLDNYLKQAGKENVRVSLKSELKNLMQIQAELNEKKKNFHK